MRITAKSDAVTRIDLDGYDDKWQQKILFLSDIHIDSPWCELKLLKQHLDMAKDENALILIAGDLFDAMQGKGDPRASYRDLLSRLKQPAYFDEILKMAFDLLLPYKDNLAMIGYGNHEYSVLHFNGTDLVQRFVAMMRSEGSQIVAGGYGGFVRISAYAGMDTPDATMWINYNHGSGGEAPVTKGVIQTNRQAAYIRNCDALWNGHNHQSYILPIATMYPNNKDVIQQGLIYFLRTPGYKNEYSNPAHGFAASRMMAPTPKGCIMGNLTAAAKQHRLLASYTQLVV